MRHGYVSNVLVTGLLMTLDVPPVAAVDQSCSAGKGVFGHLTPLLWMDF